MKLSKQVVDEIRSVVHIGSRRAKLADVLLQIAEQGKFLAALAGKLGGVEASELKRKMQRLAGLLEQLRAAAEVASTESQSPPAAPAGARRSTAGGAEPPAALKKAAIAPPATAPAWRGPVRSAKVHIDGCSKGNPGPASGGIVFTTPTGDPLHEESVDFPDMTNNAAEYQTLLRALEIAAEKGVENLFVFSDSELVVKQLNGEYKIKNPDLAALAADIQRTRRAFRQCTFSAIPREKNKRADELANHAIRDRKKAARPGAR